MSLDILAAVPSTKPCRSDLNLRLAIKLFYRTILHTPWMEAALFRAYLCAHLVLE